MPSYDVVIVTHNSAEEIVETLNAVFRSSVKPKNVIVVDSCSQDQTVKLVAEKFPAVKVSPQTKNIGFGRANNIGFQLATSEYILLVNPDLKLDPDCAKILLKSIVADRHMAAISPLIYEDTGKTRIYSFGTTLSRSGFAYHPTNPQTPVNCFTGACALLRTALARKYRFNDRFFLYYEEAELSVRLLKDGYRFGRDNRAIAYHAVGRSGPRDPATALGFRQFYAIQNRWYAIGAQWPLSQLPLTLSYNLGHWLYFCLFYLRKGQWRHLAIFYLAPLNFIQGLLVRSAQSVPKDKNWYQQLSTLTAREMGQVKQTVVQRV